MSHFGGKTPNQSVERDCLQAALASSLRGFGALRGFACVRFGRFKPFWPLALVQ